jgi:hypothetical protein
VRTVQACALFTRAHCSRGQVAVGLLSCVGTHVLLFSLRWYRPDSGGGGGGGGTDNPTAAFGSAAAAAAAAAAGKHVVRNGVALLTGA